MEPIQYFNMVQAVSKFHPDLYRFLSKVKVNNETGCWEWIGAKWSGYGKFKFNGAFEGAHRVSYQLFIKKIDDGMIICHKCDNPKCVNPYHLFEGTYYDNAIDAIQKGRMRVPDGRQFTKGHISTNRSLTEDVVMLIKQELRANKLTMPKIAEKYGVKYQTVRDIKANRAYMGVK